MSTQTVTPNAMILPGALIGPERFCPGDGEQLPKPGRPAGARTERKGTRIEFPAHVNVALRVLHKITQVGNCGESGIDFERFIQEICEVYAVEHLPLALGLDMTQFCLELQNGTTVQQFTRRAIGLELEQMNPEPYVPLAYRKTGVEIPNTKKQCPKCGGSGVVMRPLNIKCPHCDGEGQL